MTECSSQHQPMAFVMVKTHELQFTRQLL